MNRALRTNLMTKNIQLMPYHNQLRESYVLEQKCMKLWPMPDRNSSSTCNMRVQISLVCFDIPHILQSAVLGHSAELSISISALRPEPSILRGISTVNELMDNVQTKIFRASQRLNDLTGYASIEHLKLSIEDLESQTAVSQELVRQARAHYKQTVAERASTQREVTTLLARKDTWSG